MKRSCTQQSLGAFFVSTQKSPSKESPSKKRKIDLSTNTTRSPKGKSSKHRETFYTPWLKKYTWLVYEDDEGMFCSLCTKFKQTPKNSSIWVNTGAKSFREDVIRNHERSNHHRVAVDMERDAILSAKNRGIEGAIQKVVSVERQAFVSAIKCMYFLMKKELPHTTNYPHLLDLAKSIGCSYLDVLNPESRVNYTSYRTMQEMVWCLGETIREDIISKLQASPFYSILIDETTDISILKQLIVYAKFLENSTPKVKFLAIEDLMDGRAETITETLKTVLHDHDIPVRDRLAALGSDGAAVMVGKKTGVATRLKEESPMIISNHCVAHRLALAVRQAGDTIPHIKAFNVHLDSVYRFYENSPVRLAALKEIQTITDNPILKPKQPKTMRWLSHDKACDTLRQIFPSVLMSLEREAEERHDSLALGLARNLQTYSFIYILHMMCDILPQLSILSKCFQESGLDYSSVQDHVSMTLEFLDSRLTIPGRHYSQASAVILGLEEHFKISKKGCSDMDDFKTKVHDRFCLAVIDNIKDRFPNTGLLTAFSCFDPAIVRDTEIHDLDYIGEEKLEVLTDHFGSVVDAESTLLEYQSFRMILHKNQDQTFQTMLKSVCSTYAPLYPNLAQLAQICLVIPASTADCERGFSSLKRIKTQLRNRLSQKVLNALMMVSTQGPEPEEFNFARTCELWASLRQRKISIVLNDESEDHSEDDIVDNRAV